MNQREKTWSLAQPLSTAVRTQGWTWASCSPYGWKSWSQSADTLGLASKDCNAPATVFLGSSRTWGGLRGGEKHKSAERETPLRISSTWRKGGRWRRGHTEAPPPVLISTLHFTAPGTMWLPFLFLLIFKINLWGGQTCGCQRTVCRSWFSLSTVCILSFKLRLPRWETKPSVAEPSHCPQPVISCFTNFHPEKFQSYPYSQLPRFPVPPRQLHGIKQRLSCKDV